MADWKDVAIEFLKVLRWAIPAGLAVLGLGSEIDYRFNPPDARVLGTLNPAAKVVPGRTEADEWWEASEPLREYYESHGAVPPEFEVPPNFPGWPVADEEGGCQGDYCGNPCATPKDCHPACVCLGPWRDQWCVPRR